MAIRADFIAMYVGEYQLGDLFPLQLLCTTDGAGVLPDDAPRAIVISAAGGIVESVLMPVDDKRNITGRFRHFLNLDGKYAAGHHWVQYLYHVSSVLKTALVAFRIVAGGNVSGSGISMEYFRRPPNDFVLIQNDAGVLIRRKNPEVTV